MPTFVLLTRVMPGPPVAGGSLLHLEGQVTEHVRQECPGVEWITSYALLGPYDYLDIFRAPDAESAAKVATIVHLHGRSQTETWGAVPWPEFKAMLEKMPPPPTRATR
jgi:uncharacterized protein with GYD domain